MKLFAAVCASAVDREGVVATGELIVAAITPYDAQTTQKSIGIRLLEYI
jgi:hypothetical protein